MRRPPLVASIATLLAVALLMTLGFWQVQRLHWKEGLLAQLDRAYADPAPPFFTTAQIVAIPTEQKFAAARLQGQFIAIPPLQLGIRTWQGQVGYHVLAPLQLADGGVVLVNRGWVGAHTDPALLVSPRGILTVRGILHRPDRDNLFVPQNDPAHGQWFRWDLPVMAHGLQVEKLAPLVLYEQDGGSNQIPVTAALHWTLPNSHLGYAAFWFSMAGVLLVIFFLRFMR